MTTGAGNILAAVTMGCQRAHENFRRIVVFIFPDIIGEHSYGSQSKENRRPGTNDPFLYFHLFQINPL